MPGGRSRHSHQSLAEGFPCGCQLPAPRCPAPPGNTHGQKTPALLREAPVNVAPTASAAPTPRPEQPQQARPSCAACPPPAFLRKPLAHVALEGQFHFWVSPAPSLPSLPATQPDCWAARGRAEGQEFSLIIPQPAGRGRTKYPNKEQQTGSLGSHTVAASTPAVAKGRRCR